MLLEVRNATVHYHKVAALRDVSMGVPEGAVVTIIGANGAGKSTLLRAISGLEALSEGEIRFGGRRIDGTPPDKVVALGIAQVPEGRRVFPDLTVQENLNTGAREIHERGVPVVLVEQNAELALRLADYAYVLEIGSVALHGPASELHENVHVRRAYLGA